MSDICLLIDGAGADDDRQTALRRLQHKLIMGAHEHGLDVSVPFSSNDGFIDPENIDYDDVASKITWNDMLIVLFSDRLKAELFIMLGVGLGSAIPILVLFEQGEPPAALGQIHSINTRVIPSLDCLSDIRSAVKIALEGILEMLDKEAGSGKS